MSLSDSCLHRRYPVRQCRWRKSETRFYQTESISSTFHPPHELPGTARRAGSWSRTHLLNEVDGHSPQSQEIRSRQSSQSGPNDRHARPSRAGRAGRRCSHVAYDFGDGDGTSDCNRIRTVVEWVLCYIRTIAASSRIVKGGLHSEASSD